MSEKATKSSKVLGEKREDMYTGVNDKENKLTKVAMMVFERIAIEKDHSGEYWHAKVCPLKYTDPNRYTEPRTLMSCHTKRRFDTD